MGFDNNFIEILNMDNNGYNYKSTTEDKLNLVASQHVYNEAYDENFSTGQPVYLNIYPGKTSRNKTKHWIIGGVLLLALVVVATVSITLLVVEDEGSSQDSTIGHTPTTPIPESTSGNALSTTSGMTHSPVPSTTVPGSTTDNIQSTTPSQTHSPEPTSSTTVTTPSSTVSTTTQAPGEWGEWSSWSECSVSCDKGYITRTRECSELVCRGSFSHSEECRITACYDPMEAYRTWATWSSWLPCSKTCGEGDQSRSRECEEDPQKEYCLGEATIYRNCNNGACLVEECEHECEQGELVNCTHCVCTGEVYSGTVLTESGEPISNVIISHAEIAGMDFAITGEDGIFSMSNVCPGTPLKYSRQGYTPQSEKNTKMEQNIVMTRFNRLTIQRESRGGARLAGGCVTLTCDVTGSPGPDYYEWFKNGNMTQNTNQTWIMDDLAEEDSGLYYCRASNDHYAVYSHGYTVWVKNKTDDFCASPTSYIKHLPTGCLYDNMTTIEAMRCFKSPCSSEKGTCDEQPKSTCGVTKYDAVTVTCDGYQFNTFIAKECGCIPGEQPTYDIRGLVISAEDFNPVIRAHVSINGTVVTDTDNSGQFAIRGIIESTRLVITIDEPYDVYAQLVRVIDLNEDDTNIQYVVFKVPERRPSIEIDSSNGITLKPGNKKFSTGFAEILIPPNSLYSKNGTRYNGKANIAIEQYDPRDIGSIESAPGDFSSIDSEGEDDMLLSRGMFRLNIRDPNGNDLNLGGKIRISFEAPIDTTYADGLLSRTRLWSMKPDTGKWDFVSDMTLDDDYLSKLSNTTLRNKKNDFGKFYSELDGIEISDHWSNFDSISEVTCHSKIRIFNREGNWDQNEINGAEVGVLILETNHTRIDGNTVSTYRAHTDNGDFNGYCLIHPCDSPRNYRPPYNFTGYIGAQHKNTGQIFVPDPENRFPDELRYNIRENAIEVKLDLTVTPQNGPFYDWESNKWRYSKACSDANIHEKHFRFYLNALGDCSEYSYNVKDEVEPPPSTDNFYAWDTGDGYTFIKVLIENGDSYTTVQARSTVGKSIDGVVLKEGEYYGVREQCPENRAVCLEGKASGYVGTGHPLNRTNYGDVLTQIEITLVNVSYTNLNVEPSNHLRNDDRYKDDFNITAHGVQILIKDINGNPYEAVYGIYNHRDDKQKALNKCRRGSNEEQYSHVRIAMTAENPAFTFFLN